ncbi:2-keto-4-pentenoate hydratase [Cryptosporangium sp. NPDC048952]|uniref:2-keto-4-pentenoate hydratase n=1 Tax=Cryptosporangium sp. NPDC048952 TaxID=3363961 RepID=UPI00371938F9
MTDIDVLHEAAERLLTAERERRPGSPVRDLLGDSDIAAAYAVQQRVIAAKLAAGARQIGRKIGLTSEAVQKQVGVDRPDFGLLLDDMLYRHGDAIPISRLLQPRAEAEIAFVLAEDIEDPDVTPESLTRAVAYASPAIEVVDSRVRDWDIVITDTVADNASSGVFVLGSAQLSLEEFVPRTVTMRMLNNGVEVSAGDGTACLGDPLAAVAWLARTAIEFGAPLRAGEIVLSGALGPLAPVAAGDELSVLLRPLGTVSVTFTGGEQA